MRKANYVYGIVILFLLVSLIPWPMAKAITPQSQTISIIDTDDDMFITEAGVGIDSQLCHILDPNMDIRSFLVFEDVKINFWEPLFNATLRLRTTSNLDFDADSSVTVYGMKYSNLQREGILNPGWVISVPLTSASVNVNTSQFYGQQWHEINVTEIVRELVDSIRWDGDGADGTETGDSIGFVILGAEGSDTRWFIDYLYGVPTLAPQLVIHWNHEPPPPAGFPLAEFNGTYRGYNIWLVNASDVGWIDYGDYTFYNISNGQSFGIPSDSVITGNLIQTANTYDFRLRRVNPINFGFVLMSVNITEVVDANVGKDNVGHFFGHADVNKNVFNIDNDLNNGVFLGIATPTNQTDSIFAFAINTHRAGAWNILYGQEYNITADHDRYYLNITYNYPAQDFIVQVFSDSTFTNELENINRTGYINILAGGYTNEFAFNTESRGGHFDRFSFNTITQTGALWFVTDENGTTITDDCATYECALISIEDELGADPEDPAPPGTDWESGPGGETGPFTRFRMRRYILIIGFSCFFGPVLFFSWRRPTGYYLLVGALIMIMGIGFMISIGDI